MASKQELLNELFDLIVSLGTKIEWKMNGYDFSYFIPIDEDKYHQFYFVPELFESQLRLTKFKYNERHYYEAFLDETSIRFDNSKNSKKALKMIKKVSKENRNKDNQQYLTEKQQKEIKALQTVIEALKEIK